MGSTAMAAITQLSTERVYAELQRAFGKVYKRALKLSATSMAGDAEECGLLVQVLKPADLKLTVIAASDLIFQVRLGEREVHDLKRDFGHTSKPFGEFLKSFVDSLNSLARVEISGASKECLGRAKVVVSYRIDSAHTLSVPISAPRVDRSTYYHLLMEIISEEQQVVKETAVSDSQNMNASQKPVTSQSGRTSSIASSESVSFASREGNSSITSGYSPKKVSNTQGKVKARVKRRRRH